LGDFRHEDLILLRSGAAQIGYAFVLGVAPIPRRSNLQHFADGLGSIGITVLIYKGI
jgi:hypothetical protein